MASLTVAGFGETGVPVALQKRVFNRAVDYTYNGLFSGVICRGVGGRVVSEKVNHFGRDPLCLYCNRVNVQKVEP